MESKLFVVVSLLCLYFSYAISYHVECLYEDKDETITIRGLESVIEFNEYLIRCGQTDAIVLIYDQCHVGNVMIPVQKIIKNYPKIRTIYWMCKGNCNYPSTYVGIFGCKPGTFSIYSLISRPK